MKRPRAVALLCLLPLSACHPKLAGRLPPAAIGYTASLSLKIVKDTHRTSARGFMAVLRGQLLRLELHDPAGATRLLLVLRDGPSLLWVQGEAIYRGDGGRMVSRLLSRELPAGAFIGALTGDEPAPAGLSVLRTNQGDGKQKIVLSIQSASGDHRLTVTMKLRRMEPIADSSRLLSFAGGTGDEERPIESLPSIWELVDR